MGTTNRHRHTDRLIRGVCQTRDYGPAGDLEQTIDHSFYGGVHSGGSFKSIDDVAGMSRREYWETRRKGGVIMHPLILVNDTRESISSNWVFGPHPVWGRLELNGNVSSAYYQAPSGAKWSKYLDYVAEDKDRAITEAYAKMNSPDALAKVIFDEFEKTAHLVASTSQRAAYVLEGGIPDLERRMLQAGALPNRRLSSFRSWWLGMRFGVRPLIADIDGAAKAVAQRKPQSGKLLVARGGVQRDYDEPWSTLNRDIERGIKADLVGQWSIKTKTSAGVVYSVVDITEPQWRAHALGLSSDSTPSNEWEEMPYSWTVDYFFKVGQWISARTPNPFIRINGDWVTQVMREKHTSSVPSARITINNTPVTTYTQGGGSTVFNIDSVHRDVDVGVPLSPPSVGKPLTLAKAVDLAATAGERLFGVFRKIDSIVRL